MNRKDTIIIAILVNAALLVALFVTAIKKDPAQQKVVATPLKEPVFDQILEPPKQSNMEIKTARGDEVDVVLKEFSQSRPNSNQGGGLQQPGFAFADKVEDSGVKNDVEIKPTAAFSSDAFPSTFKTQPITEKNESALVSWTVKKGDALEKIARLHSTTVDEIIKLNDLKTTSLRIGQVLKVNTVKGTSTFNTQEVSSKEAAPKYYTVKTGDNPWTIAVKNHMKLEELLKLNHLNEEKARRLKPGDKLRIR